MRAAAGTFKSEGDLSVPRAGLGTNYGMLYCHFRSSDVTIADLGTIIVYKLPSKLLHKYLYRSFEQAQKTTSPTRLAALTKLLFKVIIPSTNIPLIPAKLPS